MEAATQISNEGLGSQTVSGQGPSRIPELAMLEAVKEDETEDPVETLRS
jgi:hypothetical protein